MRWFHGTKILNRGFRKLASRMKSSRFAAAWHFHPLPLTVRRYRPALKISRRRAYERWEKCAVLTWNVLPPRASLLLSCFNPRVLARPSYSLSIFPPLTPAGYLPLSFILITSRKRNYYILSFFRSALCFVRRVKARRQREEKYSTRKALKRIPFQEDSSEWNVIILESYVYAGYPLARLNRRDVLRAEQMGLQTWILTCGILNSRRRLATWIDVTELAAPTTPLIIFRTAVLLQWYSAPSMLLIEPGKNEQIHLAKYTRIYLLLPSVSACVCLCMYGCNLKHARFRSSSSTKL